MVHSAGAVASLCALLLLLGCEKADQTAAQGDSSTTKATQANNAAQDADAPEKGANMKELRSPQIKIAASDAASHKLPAATISFNTGETYMSGHTFPEKDLYLRLSGPPGGPLGMEILRVSSVPKNQEGWQQLAEKRYEGRSVESGQAAEVEITGDTRSAFTFTSDEEEARAHHVMVGFPVPQSNEGIVVDFWSAAGDSETPAPDAMLGEDAAGSFLRKLTIRFE